LMGPFTNSRWYNVVAWATTAIMIVLTLIYLWTLRSGGA
jgi:Mn2+/Fe2+ NRAMP family transporter